MSDPMEGAPDAALTPDELARATALERRIVELEATLHARLIRAELKAEAVRHGMVDLDGLKLVDPSAVTLDDNGEVRGASTLMRELKRAKPWLFGGASTSSVAAAPPAQQPKPRMAREMSHEEWQAARAELVRRR
jgi:hypothetical protein